MKLPLLARITLVILLLALSAALLHLGRGFFIPLAFGLLLALLFMPLADRLEARGFGRAAAALACILVFVLAVALLFGLLGWQLAALTDNLPKMEQQLGRIGAGIREWISSHLGIPEAEQKKMVEEQAKQSKGNTGKLVMGAAAALTGALLNFILVLVYTFLYLCYRRHFKAFILKLVPAGGQAGAKAVIAESRKTISGYLSGMAMMIGTLWVLYGIGFSIVGIEAALFFAVLCGVLEIVPFIGNLTGSLLATLMAVAQGGDAWTIGGVLLVYAVVQFSQTYLIEPLVVGAQVSINPFFTIAVLVLGELIWGIAGMILALPLLGMVKIVLDKVPDLQPWGFLIGNAEKAVPRKSRKRASRG